MRTCASATRRGWKAPRCGSRSRPRATSPTPRARRCSRPFRLRGMHLKNRVVVSPMAQYRAVDGTPTDWHLVHLAERAKGGAGLVVTEMTCVSPEGRITPGCTGLYAPAHEAAWKRIVDFVHAETDAKIAIQLGHSGPKGSTQLGWEEMDAPLARRQLGGDGALAGAVVAAQPGAARDDARRHGRGCAPSTCAAAADGRARRLRHAGAALRPRLSAVGVHHPLTNRRSDEYGGSLETACASRWRSTGPCARCGRRQKPISVRISANDWVGSRGITPADAVEIARLLQAGGRGHHRRVRRADLHRGAPRLRPHVPDAVLGPHPQRGGHRHHGGRQHHRGRPRQLDPDGRPRGPRLPGPPAPGRSLLDAARRRRARAITARPGPSPTSRAATSSTGWRRAPTPAAERV